ncbi:hypothetical protein J3R82DRAFT_9026 [Butyriboletus roseoflavus]|nr:hypothetical protein J3R82DRAFT_9026 [Butyriboletus roseoflavus]
MDQLNVFAGQLYLKDYETYIRLCRFLCVYARDMKGKGGIKVGPDGFIPPRSRPKYLQTVDTFQRTPMTLVRSLMGLRRKGMRFASTHMGRLLDGRLLSEDDFDDEVCFSLPLESWLGEIDDSECDYCLVTTSLYDVGLGFGFDS